MRLIGIGLRVRVVGLREVIGQWGTAAGHGPLVVAAIDALVPHGSVAARELVLQEATTSIGHAAEEVLTVLRVTLEAVLLAQAGGVLQVLCRRLSCRFWLIRLRLFVLLNLLLMLLLLWLLLLLLDRFVVLHFIGQLTAIGAVSVPGVHASSAHRVVNSSADTFETECGGLSTALVDAPIKDTAIAVVRVVSVAGAFVRPRDTALESCNGRTRR